MSGTVHALVAGLLLKTAASTAIPSLQQRGVITSTCKLSLSDFGCSTNYYNISDPSFEFDSNTWNVGGVTGMRVPLFPACQNLDIAASTIYINPGACNILPPSSDGDPGPDGIPDGPGGFVAVAAFSERDCKVESIGSDVGPINRRAELDPSTPSSSGSRTTYIKAIMFTDEHGYRGCWDIGFLAKSMYIMAYGQKVAG